MGLFDFLSKDPSKRIPRLEKKILDQHQQQQVRQESLDELVSIGNEEAIGSLVKRLGTNFRDSIKNEQEKRWVHETLVNHFGQQAIGPLAQFIGSNQTISAAIRTLAELVEQKALIELLVDTLTSYDPKDHRSIEARLQLVDALADLEDPRIVPAVIPYALDHDDDVRVKVIELLEARVTKESAEYAAVVEQFVAVLQDALASGRITRRAADALSALGADLSAQATDLTDFVPDGYRFGPDGVLTRT